LNEDAENADPFKNGKQGENITLAKANASAMAEAPINQAQQ
jgi:hypothetical protein